MQSLVIGIVLNIMKQLKFIMFSGYNLLYKYLLTLLRHFRYS